MLQEPKIVYNIVPYLDDNCPTIAIAWKLKREKWRGVERLCKHETAAVGIFDSYPAVKMKTYYQVLLKLRECLRLSTVVPSRQPILYYRLLLAGQRVEPYLGQVVYLPLWNGLVQAGRVPDLPLEPPSPSDLPPPVEDGGSDEDVLLPSRPPLAASNRRKTDAPPVPHAKARPVIADPPGPPPLPPPPLVLPPVVVPPGPVVDPPDPVPVPPVDVDPPPVEDDDDVLMPAVDDAEVPRPRGRKRPDRWHDGINCRVRYDPDYITPGGVRFSANWTLQCTRPGHHKCFKKKHVSAASTALCGDIQPLALLHVWQEVDPEPGKRHNSAEPTSEQVAGFAAEHGAELWDVYHRVVG